MKITHERLILNKKNYELELLFIEEDDRSLITHAFSIWLDLNKNMQQLHSRKINLPEGLSESIFSLEFNCPRVIGGASFDAIDLEKQEKLQIKATSVNEDLTSFSPNSNWDVLYFMDFCREGKVDGTIDVYRIPPELNRTIYNLPIGKNGQTFKQQQKQGRRPRFSIKKHLIEEYDIKPNKTIKIL